MASLLCSSGKQSKSLQFVIHISPSSVGACCFIIHCWFRVILLVFYFIIFVDHSSCSSSSWLSFLHIHLCQIWFAAHGKNIFTKQVKHYTSDVWWLMNSELNSFRYWHLKTNVIRNNNTAVCKNVKKETKKSTDKLFCGSRFSSHRHRTTQKLCHIMSMRFWRYKRAYISFQCWVRCTPLSMRRESGRIQFSFWFRVQDSTSWSWIGLLIPQTMLIIFMRLFCAVWHLPFVICGLFNV